MKKTYHTKQITILLSAVCLVLAAFTGSAKPPAASWLVQVEGVPISRETYSLLLSDALLETPLREDGHPENLQALRGELRTRCAEMVAINSELHNMGQAVGLPLKVQVADRTSLLWQAFRSYYKSIGVSKPTLNAVLTGQAAREQLFLALYDTHGPREVPESAIQEYFYSTYAAYDGVRVFLTAEDGAGNEQPLNAEQKKSLRVTLEALVAAANEELGLLDAAQDADYARARHYALPMTAVVQKGVDGITAADIEKIRALEPDKAALLEFPQYFLVARGINMEEEENQWEYYDSYRNTCLKALRGEEYESLLDQLCTAYRADENTVAVDRLLKNWPWHLHLR